MLLKDFTDVVVDAHVVATALIFMVWNLLNQFQQRILVLHITTLEGKAIKTTAGSGKS